MIFALALIFTQCGTKEKTSMKIYETSRGGNSLTEVSPADGEQPTASLKVLMDQKRQTITGFGGAFTEASAYLLNELSPEHREEILQAYFSDEGAKYSLTRTHMNSCDFSRRQYSYAPVAGDKHLHHFSVEHDRDYLIPMIKAALRCSA